MGQILHGSATTTEAVRRGKVTGNNASMLDKYYNL